jgi:hypothetical protein
LLPDAVMVMVMEHPASRRSLHGTKPMRIDPVRI